MCELQEMLIGFAAREVFQDFRKVWTLDQSSHFLLKEDIFKPLSVDVMVWDCVLHALEIELPDWVGPRQLWEDLDALRAFVAVKAITQPYWMIAITQWVTADEQRELEEKYGAPPAFPKGQKMLLGFDVADDYLLSGLMNCGYWADERKVLIPQWTGCLNQYHLFGSLEAATAFKTLTDRRVKEHSPFHVYGIYLLARMDSTSRTDATKVLPVEDDLRGAAVQLD